MVGSLRVLFLRQLTLFVLSGQPYHFQMEKGKENGHGQAYAPNGAMGLK